MSEDKELKQWKEKLFYQPKNGYDQIDAEQTGEIFAYAEGYKRFLDAARTEREAVKEAIRMAEEAGFVPYTFGMELQPGSKVYVNNRGKALMLAVLGQQPLDQCAAHIAGGTGDKIGISHDFLLRNRCGRIWNPPLRNRAQITLPARP